MSDYATHALKYFMRLALIAMLITDNESGYATHGSLSVGLLAFIELHAE